MAKKTKSQKLFKRQQEAAKTWALYQDGIAYQDQLGIRKDIPIWVDYYEGRQWAKTKENKNIPLPVFNFIKLIVDNKHGNILSSPVKLNFIADNDREGSDRFTKFVEYDSKEMRLNEVDDRNIYSSLIKGTGVYHFYFDDKAIGKLGNYEGAVRCEDIDPLNFFVSDPTNKDIQRQEWVLIASRVSVQRAKEMYQFDEKEDLKKICADDMEHDEYAEHFEQDNEEDSGFCTILTKYFRIDGEVYFQLSTKDVLLCDPQCCNPIVQYNDAKIEKKIAKLKEQNEYVDENTTPTDKEIPTLPDVDVEIERTDYNTIQYKAYYYPVDVLALDERDGSIYGISQVESLREAQKCVNFQLALNTLAIQTLGSPKLVAKAGALRNQKITNKFGEVLTDYSPIGTQGIYAIQTNPVSAPSLTLPQTMIDLERVVSGANEVITGEMVSRDLSGTAIAQLQAQSQKPIAQLQKRFWRSKERCGKIIEQFYKLFYEEREFSRELTEQEKFRYVQGNALDKMPLGMDDTFDGRAFRKTAFNVVVEAGAGTQYSEIQTMNMISNLLQSGLIDFKTYIELMPDKALENKTKLKEEIALREQSEIMQLRNENAQLKQQLEQVSAYTKNQDSTIKDLSQRLNTNMAYTKQMQQESTTKINKLSKALVESVFGNKDNKKGSNSQQE